MSCHCFDYAVTFLHNVHYRANPTTQVRHFLEDLDRHGGRYTGFPELGISWQGLESTDMKRSLAMPESLTGVYITGTEPVYHAAKVRGLRVAVRCAVLGRVVVAELAHNAANLGLRCHIKCAC